MTAKLAATVMIFREVEGTPQILMMKRSRQVGFFPSAWVFPGGRVDQADHDFPFEGEVSGLNEKAFAVAAIRETFEEAGLWLGKGIPHPDLRDQLNQRSLSLPMDGSLVADLSRVRQWSWWITPDTEPKRYDTRFFVCCLAEDEASLATPDQSETTEARWFSLAEALDLHHQGNLFMAPPTYLTLLDLAKWTSMQEIWEQAQNREVQAIQPIHDRSVSPMEIGFPGHPKHPSSEKMLDCIGVRLENQRWVLLE